MTLFCTFSAYSKCTGKISLLPRFQKYLVAFVTNFTSYLMQAFKIHEPMCMRRHFKIIKNNLIDCHFRPCIIGVSVKRNNGIHLFRLTENRNNDSDDNLWLDTMSRKKGFAKILHSFELAASGTKGWK